MARGRDRFLRGHPLCAGYLRRGTIVPATVVDHIVRIEAIKRYSGTETGGRFARRAMIGKQERIILCTGFCSADFSLARIEELWYNYIPRRRRWYAVYPDQTSKQLLSQDVQKIR